MSAEGETRVEPADNPSVADESNRKTRDASFGIVVAVIAAALLWPIVIGLYFFVFH